MSEISDELWAQTTWEGHRRAQLREILGWSLRDRLQALEDMAEVSALFRTLRERAGSAASLLAKTDGGVRR